MATVVSDSFNRANSAVSLGNADTGQAWTAHQGTGGISSNQAYIAVDSVATDGRNWFTVDSGVADGTIQITFAVQTTSMRLVFRFVDENNLWLLQNDAGNSYQLYKRVASGFTNKGTYSVTPANGDVIKIVLSGDSIDFYLNGTLRISASDSAHNTATRHGYGDDEADAARWDDFTVVTVDTSKLLALVGVGS